MQMTRGGKEIRNCPVKEAPRSVHFFLVQTHKKTDRLMKQVVIYLAAIALLIARYVRTTERGDIDIIIIIIAH